MSNTAHALHLVGVYVGQPSLLGQNRNGDVMSGIRKRPVTPASVAVDVLNIEGDGQADLRNHGGVDKAIYCYPFAHVARWRAEGVESPAGFAAFGENLSIAGLAEADVCIGDRWQWGDALLEVAQPRWPCYKLAMHIGRNDMIKRFVASGRSGWYLRVLESGQAPTTGPIDIAFRDPQRISVAEAFDAARGMLGGDALARLNAHPALAVAWHR